MATPEDRFKQTNLLVKELAFGHAAFVHLFVTKQDAGNIIQWFRANIIDELEAFLRLRQALRTVKILDPQAGLDFDVEFFAMFHSNRIQHPNLAVMLPGQNDYFNKQWFEIEGLPAGTLKTYTELILRKDSFDHAPPVAFGWHMLHQLCEALLAFHFGASTGFVPIVNWPFFYHDDPTAANMLFRKPSRKATETSFPGYPDIVLCDLGEAKNLSKCLDHNDFYHRQYEDVKMMLTAIHELFSIRPVDDHALFQQQLQTYIDDLAELETSAGYFFYNAALKKNLTDLSASAKSGRWHAYTMPGAAESLEPNAVAYFDSNIISDDRLRRFWIKLRDDEVDDSYESKDDDLDDDGGEVAREKRDITACLMY